VGDIEFDSAFTGLTTVDGRFEHTLTAPDGRSVTLWADPEFEFVHVFISRTYPGVDRAVAVEPMTAPANAFNSGHGLRWLEPGATFAARWGIRPRLG
jgi:aldose 1-epimerase